MRMLKKGDTVKKSFTVPHIVTVMAKNTSMADLSPFKGAGGILIPQ